MTEGQEAALRTYRHARQKSFCDIERQSIIGNSVINLAFSGKPKPETIKDLQEEIKEFMSNSTQRWYADRTTNGDYRVLGQKSSYAGNTGNSILA